MWTQRWRHMQFLSRRPIIPVFGWRDWIKSCKTSSAEPISLILWLFKLNTLPLYETARWNVKYQTGSYLRSHWRKFRWASFNVAGSLFHFRKKHFPKRAALPIWKPVQSDLSRSEKYVKADKIAVVDLQEINRGWNRSIALKYRYSLECLHSAFQRQL
jgi:hypothetical protein